MVQSDLIVLFKVIGWTRRASDTEAQDQAARDPDSTKYQRARKKLIKLAAQLGSGFEMSQSHGGSASTHLLGDSLNRHNAVKFALK